MTRTLLFAVGVSLITSTCHADIFFTGVGGLNQFGSIVRGLSADGTTAVGYSIDSRSELQAFRWTLDTGIQGIGYLDPSYDSQAFGVSSDGSVIVGRAGSDAGGVISIRPFRWTQSTGMQEIPNLPGGSRSGFGNAVSHDGNTAVGWMSSTNSAPDNGFDAFRWTPTTGPQSLGDLPGDRWLGEALGISGDGNTIVGYSYSSNGHEVFRWTQSEGMVGLGDLAGGAVDGRGEDASFDGSVIVGGARSANGLEAFRWTAETGMVGLGDLDGGVGDTFLSSAFAVSADGSIVVGGSEIALNERRAFIWTEENGMQLLQDFLGANGLDLTGWTLREAFGVSDDGLVFAGVGTNPTGQTEGWVARIAPAAVPEPSSFVLLGLLGGAGLLRRATVHSRRSK